MQNLTKVSKIFLSLTILFFSLWLGGYILRQMITYQFFEPENLALKSIYSIQNLKEILITILPVFIFNIVTYAVFILSFIAFLFISKIKFKKEGWLFIITLIILICLPFEIFLLLKDIEISTKVYSGSFEPMSVINLIHERLSSLNSFSLIEIISFVSIIFLSVFRPLTKTKI
jgi:hypothetical protein